MCAQHGAQEHVYVPGQLGATIPLPRRIYDHLWVQPTILTPPCSGPGTRAGGGLSLMARLISGDITGGQATVVPKCQSVSGGTPRLCGPCLRIEMAHPRGYPRAFLCVTRPVPGLMHCPLTLVPMWLPLLALCPSAMAHHQC